MYRSTINTVLNVHLHKSSTKYLFVICMILAPLIFIPSKAIAQIGDPGSDPDEPTVPIDGGSSILVAAGAAYLIRRAKKKSGRFPGS